MEIVKNLHTQIAKLSRFFRQDQGQKNPSGLKKTAKIFAKIPTRKVMKTLTFSLTGLFIFMHHSQASAKTPVAMDAIVKENTQIWKTPGFSWRDCRGGDPIYDKQYVSEFDRDITKFRYNEFGGKKACDERDFKNGMAEKDDTITVLTDDKGKPITAINPVTKTDEFEIFIREMITPVKFYKVRNSKGFEGWIASNQISTPERVQAEAPKPTSEKKPCIETKRNPVADARDILEAVDKQYPLGATKSEAEMDRYMCIYRSGKMSFNDFMTELESFKTAAKKASEAFEMPYSMVMCTMLTESRMFFDPDERKKNPKDRYLGLTQFGPELVDDLQDLIEKPPYKEMWEKFKGGNKNLKFSDDAIRKSKNPTVPMAATALALKWIYQDRLHAKDVHCSGCSKDGKFNRKDLAMIVTGYNWGPYTLRKVAKKSAGQMRTSSPPPKETQEYIGSMESCMEKGYERTFRDTPRSLAFINGHRTKEIARLKKQISKAEREAKKTKSGRLPAFVDSHKSHIARLERLVKSNISPDHARNVAECDQHFPVK